MRAVVVDEFGAVPSVREVGEPECPADGVVVRVGACGVCRSDWHGWMGHDATMSTPYVPGHEWAGTIDTVGSAVTRWRPGDRVTAPFVQACGVCAQCQEREEQVCADQRQPGFTHDGAFAELVVAHRADRNLVALTDEVDDVTAASLGCRFATAYRAVAGHGGVRPDWWVAVHGCGGVGLSAVMIAKALGARVVAVDVADTALAAARDLGVDAVVDARSAQSPEAVGSAVRDMTGGGAHVSLDALGSAGTCRASIASLRPRGRHVQVGLMVGTAAVTGIPMARLLAEELTVVGSHGLAAREYPAMLDLVRSGALQPGRLIAQTITLDAAPTALVELGTGAAAGGLVVIDLDERRGG